MIRIEKKTEIVKVHLPIKTLIFDKDYFDWFSNHIYFLYTQSPTSTEIIREKGSIEEMNMAHWMCLDSYYQANYNDTTRKSLDVESIIKGYFEYTNN